MDHVKGESCYNETILQRNYRKIRDISRMGPNLRMLVEILCFCMFDKYHYLMDLPICGVQSIYNTLFRVHRDGPC